MSLSVLLTLFVVVNILLKILQKFCSNTVTCGGRAKYTLYFLTTSVVACGVFYAFSGFNLSVNLTTAVYGFLYAIIVFFSLISSLLVYNYGTVSTINIIANAGIMIVGPIFGKLLFGDAFDWRRLLRIGLMLGAVLLVFLDSRDKEEANEDKKKNSKGALALLTGIYVLATTLNTLLCKHYTLSPTATDENSMFFMTNVFLTLGAVAVLACDFIKGNATPKETVQILNFKNLGIWLGNVFCSTLCTILGIWILELMDVTVYTPVSSAVIIVAALITSVILREKAGIFSYLAAAVACVAMVI